MGFDVKDEKAQESSRRKKKIKRDKEEKEKDGAGGMLREAGKTLGFGGILKKMEKLPRFKERLKEIDEEIERRLKTLPIPPFSKGRRLNMPEGGVARAPSIPPGIRGAPPGGKRPGVKMPAPCEIAADVFDEFDHLLIAADLPGVEEKTIEASLDGDVLTLSFRRDDRIVKKTLKLPCAPEGDIVKIYKNGILEVKINK
ncbi:MAG: hypothetical protein HZB85_09315 [Deltaproteobacteria bacterium]|nr:hypothetical protein [Deltaproteobacteria bacterium]